MVTALRSFSVLFAGAARLGFERTDARLFVTVRRSPCIVPSALAGGVGLTFD